MKVSTMPGVLTQDRPGEDAERQRPCDSRGRDWHLDCKPSPDARVILPHKPQKEPTLSTPGSWGSGLQSCENKFPLFQTTHVRSFVMASLGRSAPRFPQKHSLSPDYTWPPHISTCAFFTVISQELVHGAPWEFRKCP